MLPGKLKIGGITYTVKICNLPDECGACDTNKNAIYINASLPDDQKMATLIHEVLHAINMELSEMEVEFLAQALYQVISDNELMPELGGGPAAFGAEQKLRG